MRTSATPSVCIEQRPSPSSGWLVITYFLLSIMTVTHQVPYFQTIIEFCPFVNALVRFMFFLHNDSICHLFLSIAYSLGQFSPDSQSVYHTSCFLPPYWLSPLKSMTYLRVTSIPWVISKAPLIPNHSWTIIISVYFPPLFRIQFSLVSLSLVSQRSSCFPINVWNLPQSLWSARV